MLLCQDRAARSHPAHHRDTLVLPQANAAGSAGQHLDIALALQGSEMVFGGIGRAEAQLRSNFRAGGWKTGGLKKIGDQLQHFGLTCGQFIHGPSPVTVIIYRHREFARGRPKTVSRSDPRSAVWLDLVLQLPSLTFSLHLKLLR